MKYIKTFIIKIASRCNLNCDYCFIYNKADDQWKHQPKVISKEVFELTIKTIFEYAAKYQLHKVSIILHGGEPLLVGKENLNFYLSNINKASLQSGIAVKIGMQSNGLLFDEEFGEILQNNKASIGISVDGPAMYQDKHRKFINGRGSGKLLGEKLTLISSNFQQILSGFLVVIDIQNDPIIILDYLSTFRPKSIDFLLPYDNWDLRPVGKEVFESTLYGDWLNQLFIHWFNKKGYPPIRMFDSMIKILLGGRSSVESIGLDPVDLIVIETNGDLEAVDSLKASHNGATKLGLNICKDTFEDASRHYSIISRQLGVYSLADECKSCEIVNVCGGGYIPNRYSSQNGFLNRSIYCYDLKKMILSIQQAVNKELTHRENKQTAKELEEMELHF